MELTRNDINYIINKAKSLIREWHGDDIISSKKRKQNMYDIVREHNLTNIQRIGDSNKCFVGFSNEEQKWYGVCMSKIYSFGVGTSMYKNDCGYKYCSTHKAKSIYDARNMAVAFVREAMELEQMEAMDIK